MEAKNVIVYESTEAASYPLDGFNYFAGATSCRITCQESSHQSGGAAMVWCFVKWSAETSDSEMGFGEVSAGVKEESHAVTQGFGAEGDSSNLCKVC